MQIRVSPDKEFIMAIGTTISGIISGILGSGSDSGDQNAKESGQVSGGLGSNILGDAVGDPAGFVFNQVRYNQQRDYQQEQDKVKNRLLNLQSDQLQIENEELRKKQKWNKDFQRIMLRGGR